MVACRNQMTRIVLASIVCELASVNVVWASPRYTVTDLGELGLHQTLPSRLNERSEVTGMSLPPSGLFKASSGWFIYTAQDINNAGQIVGVAQHVNEPWGHAVLLTPIPEPATVGLAALGLPMLSRLRRAARRIGK